MKKSEKWSKKVIVKAEFHWLDLRKSENANSTNYKARPAR